MSIRCFILVATGSLGILVLLAFQLERDADGMSYKTYVLDDYNQTRPIQYFLWNATITNIQLDEPAKTLRINYTTSGDGMLQVRLPRALIDSTDEAGNDKSYGIVVHKANSSGYENMRLLEYLATDESREYQIPFDSDTGFIEIKGTVVAPEFSPIGFVILGVALVSSIALASRYSFASRYNLK